MAFSGLLFVLESMARFAITQTLLCAVVCNMLVVCGHLASPTMFMQLNTQGATSRGNTHVSVNEALVRIDLAADAWSTTDRLLGRAGLTLRSGLHQSVCFVLVVVLFFSMCCLGDADDRCCRAASLLIPLCILLYVCFATNLLEAFMNGQRVGVWCAILCAWSFVQLVCCVPAVFCFGAALAVHEADESTPKQQQGEQLQRPSKGRAESEGFATPAPAPAPVQVYSPAPSAAPDAPASAPAPLAPATSPPPPPPSQDPLEPGAPRWIQTTTQLDSREPAAAVWVETRSEMLSPEQAAQVANVMQQTGSSQPAAVRALEECNWHGGLAARTLKSQGHP